MAKGMWLTIREASGMPAQSEERTGDPLFAHGPISHHSCPGGHRRTMAEKPAERLQGAAGVACVLTFFVRERRWLSLSLCSPAFRSQRAWSALSALGGPEEWV